jgi:2-haloacid dehalogenase
MHSTDFLRLEKAYHRCAAELGVKDSEEAATAFGASVGSWPAFPDSADALGRLQRMGLKLVILSNVNNESFNG